MKRVFAIFMVLGALLISGGVAVKAQGDTFSTPELEGTLGNYNICMKLTFNQSNNTVSGWYYYVSKGAKNKITLSGTYDGNGMWGDLTLNEKVNGKITGTFTGEYNYGNMTVSANGQWKSSAGKTLDWDVNGGFPVR